MEDLEKENGHLSNELDHEALKNFRLDLTAGGKKSDETAARSLERQKI